jgi:hypothetical protein
MTTFEQLELAAVSVARHGDAEVRQAALNDCLDEIDAGYWQGSLTVGQKRRLVAILLGLEPGGSPARSSLDTEPAPCAAGCR